jgi:hypothetical protein
MVWDPPKQQVNVTRMIIYSFIPILSIYAGWRIQKFWVLLVINIAIGFGLGVIFGFTLGPAGGWVSWIVSIPISIFVVRHYARKYNEKIASNTPPPSSNP